MHFRTQCISQETGDVTTTKHLECSEDEDRSLETLTRGSPLRPESTLRELRCNYVCSVCECVCTV